MADVNFIATRNTAPAVTPKTFGSAANEANFLYWEVHSLLCAAISLLSEFDDDAIEARTVIEIAQCKALEMQMVLDPFITRRTRTGTGRA